MLDPADSRPPYLQIAEYVTRQIADGHLRPGDKLPGRHAYQERFKVAGATVNKAIDLLKQQGVLVGRQGQGVFVLDQPPPSEEDRVSALERRVAELEQQVAGLIERGQG